MVTHIVCYFVGDGQSLSFTLVIGSDAKHHSKALRLGKLSKQIANVLITQVLKFGDSGVIS